MRADRNCTLCKLHGNAHTVCMLGTGPEPCDIMIIGEAPGKNEDLQGKPFVGNSGEILNEILEEYGIERDEVFICNAVSCRPPGNRTPTKAEIKACNKWLQYQIRMVKPKYVLMLGAVAYQAITSTAGITKARGKPFELDGIIYLPTFHPASIFHNPDNRRIIESDIELFAKIIENKGIPREKELRPHLVMTHKDVNQMLDALEGEVSFDVETYSEEKEIAGALYPWASTFATTMIGFGTAEGEFSIPTPDHPQSPWSNGQFERILNRIEKKLESVDCVITQNGKFDFLVMWVYYGYNWSRFHHFDIMLAHYLHDENSRHGLKYLAQFYYGAPDWDVDKDTKQGKKGLASQSMYHAHDLYYTRKLKNVLLKKLEREPGIKRVFDLIMMPCARLFIEVEYDGLYLDLDKMAEAEKHLRRELAKAERDLKKYEPRPQYDKKGRPIEFNWGSTQQLAKLLFGDDGFSLEVLDLTKNGKASCNESVLKRLNHPCVDALLRFRAARQQLSFFIDGWKPYIHKGCLHPSFKLHGTVTGRLSSEHPNAQQIPRDSLIRSLITAPPGWTLVECDLSQIELRIAAELANERTMLEAFATGKDVHWITCLREIARGGGQKDIVMGTAQKIKGKLLKYSEAIEFLIEVGASICEEINKEWKELRKKAKAINFGYLYGMWWKKFKIYARDNYGVTVTDKEAKESRKFFFNTYNFEPWHNRQKQFVRQHGYVLSLSGRKRRLPRGRDRFDSPERREAERQAINSPVQSFANEINLMAALQLRKEFPRSVARIVATVHDAILMWVKNPHIEKVTERLLEIMRRPKLFKNFDIKLKVPIEAEAKVGPWSQGISFEKWREKYGQGKSIKDKIMA